MHYVYTFAVHVLCSSAFKSKAHKEEHLSPLRASVHMFQTAKLSPFQAFYWTSCGQCHSLEANRWHCCIRQLCPAFKTQDCPTLSRSLWISPTSLYKSFENPYTESSQPLWFWFAFLLEVERNWVISFLSYIKVTGSNLSTFHIF